MDKKLRVLIVDDEPIAQGILETFLQKIPELELAAKCKNALDAFSFLSKQKVDLMLLDINMPEISGIELLKTLKDPPQVIFTTAYSKFALESYELNAIDYLLKPIPFQRFSTAIQKFLQYNNNDQDSQAAKLIFAKSGNKLIRIDLAELLFLEGLKDYVKLYTSTGNIVVHSTMKNMEEQLSPYNNFIRVQKSYIINLKYVSEVNGNNIKIKEKEIAIGNTYKEEVMKYLNSYKIV